jgi:hypothetical protein
MSSGQNPARAGQEASNAPLSGYTAKPVLSAAEERWSRPHARLRNIFIVKSYHSDQTLCTKTSIKKGETNCSAFFISTYN